MRVWHDDVREAPEGWIRVKTNNQAIAVLENGWPIDEISLDFDLGLHDIELPEDPDELIAVVEELGPPAENGADLVRWMLENKYVPPKITIHSWNPDGAKKMARMLTDAGHSVYMSPYKTPEAA